MSLLTELAETALEPEYRTSSAPRRSPWHLAVAVMLASALIVIAVITTTASRSDIADERADLRARVAEEEQRRDHLAAEVAQLDAESDRLQDALVTDPQAAASIQRLELATGGSPVSGPGVVIRATDAPAQADSARGLIFDSDLSRLVNGLWEAGAEAVAINGHRITSMTPIRSAGSAITVDYVSISPPYQVEAIGDPATLQARFAQTTAGSWWQYIHDNYGIGFEIKAAAQVLELPADPGMVLRKTES
ncbi:MAG: DUF881 domain-containing protein [Propionibacteriaceae bacterium]|nr:DUF881 domain-containing protein [Propionibacteriaceae bacterium]